MERLPLYRQISTLALCIPFLVHASGANLLPRQNAAPPTELPNAWEYKGCYTDSVGARTLRGASFASATQDAETCISFCTIRGYSVAGTEYSNECYCGNAISSSGSLATDGCSMGCSGSPTEACGGPNRLSIYQRSSSSGGSEIPDIVGRTGNWTSLGCYSDAGGARALANGVAPLGGAQNNSAESCIAACEVSRYKLAGTEYGQECFCGNTLDNDQTLQDDGCDMACTGNETQFCGGANRINVYGVNITRTATSSSSSIVLSSTKASSTLPSSTLASSTPEASSTPAVSSTPAASSTLASSTPVPTPASSTEVRVATPSISSTPEPTPTPESSSVISSPSSSSALSSSSVVPAKVGWHLEGCYTDGAGGRTLQAGTAVAGGMTNAKCQAACRSAGYTLAGTEYSGECYCDNQIRGNGGPAPDGDALCNMPCSGDQTEICGGPNRLTLWKFYTGNEPTGSVSVTRVSSSAVPVATGLPTGFTYKGCYVDGPGFRIMNYQQPDDPAMTIASCANKCASAGYSIAAMEYSTQCFCDDLIRMGGKLAASESECSNKCAGNQDQTCGGPSRMSVWSNQTTLKVIDVPKPVQNVSDWEYQGCITDGGEGAKVFPWKLFNETGNSPEWCLSRCKEYGYMAAGLEYGSECFCGDLDGIEKQNSQTVPETECNTPCPGNPEAICGQGNRLTWYKWTGTPIYVWQYPTGIAAGRYEFLVGGPIIPLIAQPGVNGKITLLEKHGTGADNTTGAYELDPSIGGDIFHAFRELTGITTDVFCAAGLTMPDRAGRQINIGGWSLDSTFGVRIYWPDGSPGVNGTNQWQEDVNTVKLQRGRWYPTGLVMANGSMLIVGGQDGSNGKPVPNMEILPQVGPVYEAQYLRDTDPFNLYPYLVVLPSGGIFIQYYNEARILNENSLDTVKILPNAPGAVNDPTGGRTYPLEGTQVLLPQYYPYTAPLEVLICGGASRAPRWGLDNCVSIAPDAADAQWTIERMPSRRVISCMATLPDGTFLILNGAETGEAGFNLAKNPNLNALLYDSRKPKHQRISVMANTTIARLYHSEAVVMDDGRVLVSGSDPQDPEFPQEYRYEVFLPPYLLSGAPKPTFTIAQKDWIWEADYAFTLTSSSGGAIKVSLMGSESSTHGSSMGARILFPQVSCAGTACTVKAPKGPYVAPVGWYRMFVMDGAGNPSQAAWVRIGGDPASLGNWPNAPAFQPLPGVGPLNAANARLASPNATVASNFTA